MNRLRNIIVSDPTALEKWPVIVDHIVHAESDKLRIKNLLTQDRKYNEAILESLNLWNGYGPGDQEDLIEVLREHKLNALADRILEQDLLLGTGSQKKKQRTGVWFDVGEVVHNFTGREAELERLHEVLMSSHSTESCQANIVSICGLGGIGKSSLARKYAFKCREHYDRNVIWINAETLDSIRVSFVRLAHRLGIPTSEQESIQDIAKRVYTKFQDQKSLFIFDNVEEKTHFLSIQPKIENPAKETPYILVTTRRKNVAPLPGNQLNLGVLEMDEATSLIREQLPHTEEACAEKLAEALQRLPLTLQQALAYIKEEYLSDGHCISKYLKEFQVSELKLLEDERFKEHNDYSRTTFTTWSITLARIKTMDPGESAIEVIQALAYLNPDLISVQFVESILDNETETQLGLKLLERFSMISMDKESKITIHRLVQKVIGLSLSTEQEVKVLNPVIEAIDRQFHKYKFTDNTKECVSHGLKIFPYQLRHNELMRKKSEYLCDFFYFVKYYGNYSQALEIAEKAASAYESMVGTEHEDTLKMKWKVADAHKYLDNYTRAMEILETILVLSKANLGHGHWLTLSILSSMGHVHIHSLTPDYRKAITIYDQVIPGRIKLFGRGDHTVLSAIQSKAIALRELGKVDEGLKLFQQVYKERVVLYGKEDLRTLTVLEHIGKVYIIKQESSAAVEMLREVYEGRRKVLGEMHPFTIRVKANMEHAEAELGHDESESDGTF